MTYKLYCTDIKNPIPNAVMKFNEDGSITSFIFAPDNTDYQAYLAWVAEGNIALPAEVTA
jgi:hypothetical protein